MTTEWPLGLIAVFFTRNTLLLNLMGGVVWQMWRTRPTNHRCGSSQLGNYSHCPDVWRSVYTNILLGLYNVLLTVAQAVNTVSALDKRLTAVFGTYLLLYIVWIASGYTSSHMSCIWTTLRRAKRLGRGSQSIYPLILCSWRCTTNYKNKNKCIG